MAAEQVTSVVFAIDTTEYSGNFEREMCAFVTGQIGDCEVGRKLAAEARFQLSAPELDRVFQWIEEHIVQESDDNGCCRPVSIWPTPGWYNNGMGGHYRDDPSTEEKAAKDNYESVKAFNAGQLAMVNKRLEEGDFEPDDKRGGWNKAACERTKERLERQIEEARTKKLDKYPAYMSVAIFFDEIPPDEVIEAMIVRAKEFALKRPDWKSYRLESEKTPLTITAFRILTPSLSKPCNIEYIEFSRIEV